MSLAHMDEFDISIMAVLTSIQASPAGPFVRSRAQIHRADRVAGSWHLHSTLLLTLCETANSEQRTVGNQSYKTKASAIACLLCNAEEYHNNAALITSYDILPYDRAALRLTNNSRLA